MPDYLKICEEAARSGGAILLDWADRFGVHEKGPADLVTEADFASQERIREILLGAFPTHAFLGEEGPVEDAGDFEFRWIVDPLDGTMNYVHRVPEYAVSIALEHRGEIVAATIFNPISGECFCSESGGGAYLDGHALETSGVERLTDALVAASLSPRVTADAVPMRQMVTVATHCQGLRRTGSAALNLCNIAAGRFDGYWATTTKVWDIAAGLLIVHEAGGVMTDFEGQRVNLDDPDFIAAATPALHAELSGLLRGVS